MRTDYRKANAKHDWETETNWSEKERRYVDTNDSTMSQDNLSNTWDETKTLAVC